MTMPESPLTRWLPCVACGHDHGYLPCDQRDCPCAYRDRNGIETALGG